MLAKLNKQPEFFIETNSKQDKKPQNTNQNQKRSRIRRGKSIPINKKASGTKINLNVRRKMNESAKLAKKAVQKRANFRRDKTGEMSLKEKLGLASLEKGRLELKRKLAENRFDLSNVHSGRMINLERFPQSTKNGGKNSRLFNPVKSNNLGENKKLF